MTQLILEHITPMNLMSIMVGSSVAFAIVMTCFGKGA
jgi:hypothetical protein